MASLKIVEIKEQCISLKPDRTQCVRNVGDNSQFCWQHQNAQNKYGTVLAPAPVKAKSNRGRPKGSICARKKNLILISANASNSGTPSINNNILDSVVGGNNSTDKIISNHLSTELFRDINFILNEETNYPETQVGIGPFTIEVPVGAKDHINILKEIQFLEGKYTIMDICNKIKEFFNTQVKESDIKELTDLTSKVDNNNLYNGLNIECTSYLDLQKNMLKVKSIVCRDSKYVCVMEAVDV